MGGSVHLKTEAPATAIICAPCLIDDGMDEGEFLVDRRRLGRVEVVDRFSEITPA
ncbi:hypothetical protein [Bosea sp. (in: a-proteobacteria)]|uniref:hypothetical protein n=1 Tax=Bosea sp. (in: a-proteobacteria) TaxID=1871050 RepID=UPI001AC20D71|nr:hypothetical protein [Bosea sp. (in: a-proteobacteria)]MBN9438065.1 hypothetical protein [Bosea sp. (in: a-proteobacteria)]